MIKGIGTDLFEVHRMSERLLKEPEFAKNIFTSKEIEYCEKLKNKAQSYAARFAAKEAFFKALGTGWRNGLSFEEVEVLNDTFGKPELHLTGKSKIVVEKMEISNIHLSISHTKNYALAFVIIEN